VVGGGPGLLFFSRGHGRSHVGFAQVKSMSKSADGLEEGGGGGGLFTTGIAVKCRNCILSRVLNTRPSLKSKTRPNKAVTGRQETLRLRDRPNSLLVL